MNVRPNTDKGIEFMFFKMAKTNVMLSTNKSIAFKFVRMTKQMIKSMSR